MVTEVCFGSEDYLDKVIQEAVAQFILQPRHITLTTLRTSVRESSPCTKSMEVPYCNLELHLYIMTPLQMF